MGGHTLPKVTLQELLRSCMAEVLAAYEKLMEQKQEKVPGCGVGAWLGIRGRPYTHPASPKIEADTRFHPLAVPWGWCSQILPLCQGGAPFLPVPFTGAGQLPPDPEQGSAVALRPEVPQHHPDSQE